MVVVVGELARVSSGVSAARLIGKMLEVLVR